MNIEDICFCTVWNAWTWRWYTFYTPWSSNLVHEAN